MWLELNPTTKATEDKVYDILPRPVKDYEVRVVVWDTKDIVAMDWEGTSDLYVRAFFDSNDAKETDTHFRCSDGKGSFNYRLLFNMKCPTDHYLFSLQAWDRDFFKSNDVIGEVQFDLKPLFEDVIETGKTIAMNRKYYDSYLQGVLPADLKIKFHDDDSFWIPIVGPNEKTKEL
mmetsp:Transcript_30279/g.29598  ORF Transcript_30279/g.29598 Transcript_30279/m.29598 type:complete len:175 (-) Transcript_30279:121-645(-)